MRANAFRRFGLAVAMLLLVVGPGAAQELRLAQATSGCCSKVGEWTSNFNKNCVYDCNGSEVVRTIGSTQLCPLSLTQSSPAAAAAAPATQRVCFKKGEWVSGMNKNCVYDCNGSERVKTIGSTQFCPFNLN